MKFMGCDNEYTVDGIFTLFFNLTHGCYFDIKLSRFIFFFVISKLQQVVYVFKKSTSWHTKRHIKCVCVCVFLCRDQEVEASYFVLK